MSMAPKRKASFPVIPASSENDNDPSTRIQQQQQQQEAANETPRHLHSRTRKRFRNNRPSDEVVYGGLSIR